ncbi:hypothetical protein ACFQYP_35555 [Nonomuraea antimicrobica]
MTVLYLFGFDRIGVAVSDIYFVDPEPLPGQEGAERGVRLELRYLEAGELKGSIYSARPIAVDRPLWRVDLLESVEGTPGSFDRTHHHPGLDGWEPGRRVFDKGLSQEPLKWLAEHLADLEGCSTGPGCSVTRSARPTWRGCASGPRRSSKRSAACSTPYAPSPPRARRAPACGQAGCDPPGHGTAGRRWCRVSLLPRNGLLRNRLLAAHKRHVVQAGALV